MKPNSLATRPTILLESSLRTFNTKSQRQKPGVIKLMPPPTPPDASTIRKLNALAAKHPFCALHKVKKHDTL
jgi:hypothetical protein